MEAVQRVPPRFIHTAQPVVLDEDHVRIDYCYALDEDTDELIEIKDPIVIDRLRLSKINGSDGANACIDIYALGPSRSEPAGYYLMSSNRGRIPVSHQNSAKRLLPYRIAVRGKTLVVEPQPTPEEVEARRKEFVTRMLMRMDTSVGV